MTPQSYGLHIDKELNSPISDKNQAGLHQSVITPSYPHQLNYYSLMSHKSRAEIVLANSKFEIGGKQLGDIIDNELCNENVSLSSHIL